MIRTILMKTFVWAHFTFYSIILFVIEVDI